MVKNNESINFQAEISQLMNIIINNFYSNNIWFCRQRICTNNECGKRIQPGGDRRNETHGCLHWHVRGIFSD